MTTSWKTFENVSLPVIPSGASIKFRKLNYLDSIDETQQCLLDNLWSSCKDLEFLIKFKDVIKILI